MKQCELVKKLPDCYRKKADSNNNKLLSLNEQAINQLQDNIQLANDYLDLSLAKGKTLDFYGDVYQQKRGGLDDTQYRYMILTKIASNMVGADYKSILQHIVKMFNCNHEDISIEDVGNGTVKLTKMPIDVLLNAGFTTKQAVAMIELLLPVGIKFEAEVFEGTFEFGVGDNEYSDESGFDYGELSMLFGEDDETPLPI